MNLVFRVKAQQIAKVTRVAANRVQGHMPGMRHITCVQLHRQAVFRGPLDAEVKQVIADRLEFGRGEIIVVLPEPGEQRDRLP